MKIPKKVKIGAVTYNVEFEDKMLANRGMYGEVDYSRLVITIASDTCGERQFNTFVHELLHAILFEAGEKMKQDERWIRSVSNTLTQVIVDNEWSINKPEKVFLQPVDGASITFKSEPKILKGEDPS